MSNQDFKYDVAFSFLSSDEELATQINDLLEDRISTFIYPQKQKELAGKDGEKILNQVFSSEARIVFVLYRKDWGKTPWTRIEETAIRNRAYNKGYDFVTFAPFDKTPLPEWLPKNRIWIDIDRYGVIGAASVIEARVQEAWGEIREETVEDRAARLRHEIDSENAKQKFLDSIEGVQSAKKEVNKLFGELEQAIKHPPETESSITLSSERNNIRELKIYGDGFELLLHWSITTSNSIRGSALYLVLFQLGGMYESPKRLREIEFNFDLNKAGNPGWRDINRKMFYSTEDFAKEAITILLSKIHDYRISKGKDLLGI
jgi:hypothetical protein